MICSYVYDNLETCKEPVKEINFADLGLREMEKLYIKSGTYNLNFNLLRGLNYIERSCCELQTRRFTICERR